MLISKLVTASLCCFVITFIHFIDLRPGPVNGGNIRQLKGLKLASVNSMLVTSNETVFCN